MEAPLQVSIRGELCFNENLALKALVRSFVHCLGSLVGAAVIDGGVRSSREVTCGDVPYF